MKKSMPLRVIKILYTQAGLFLMGHGIISLLFLMLCYVFYQPLGGAPTMVTFLLWSGIGVASGMTVTGLTIFMYAIHKGKM